MRTHLYCVSDWSNYILVHASSPEEAISHLTNRSLKRISNVTDDSVSLVMCCLYEHLEHILENCTDDMQRVLILNEYPHTIHFNPFG